MGISDVIVKEVDRLVILDYFILSVLFENLVTICYVAIHTYTVDCIGGRNFETITMKISGRDCVNIIKKTN